MSRIGRIPAPAITPSSDGSPLSHAFARLGRRLDRFLFRPGSAMNLGICRAFFFLGVLIFHLPRDLTTWATVPKAYWQPIFLFKLFHLTVLTYSHTRWVIKTWEIAAVLACIGLLTRPATIVSFILSLYVLGLPHNFGKVGHGDPVLIFTMLILALSRCGDGFSVDAWIRNKWRARKKKPSLPRRGGEYTWPIRLAWVLLSIVFSAAGATKLIRSGLAWITSDNLQILLLQHHYALKAPITSLGLVIAHHPMLCKVLAGMSVATELAFPLSLFSRRLRFILVPGAFLMQIGIGLAMGVYFTQFMICYLFWVPWGRLARSIRRRWRRRAVTSAGSRQ